MTDANDPRVHHGAYKPLLVAGSILIAIFASYTALDLANSLTSARGRTHRAWLVGGSLAMGLGIWSMHFIGMLAFRLPGITIAYDVQRIFLSIIVAVAASAFALAVVSRPYVHNGALAAAALFMGASICGMHYVGIWSMRIGAQVWWDVRLVIASIVIAITAAAIALWLAFRFRGNSARRGFLLRAAGAVVMGIAIAGMHYTAMFAMAFTPAAEPITLRSNDLLATDGLAVAVTFTTALILGIAIAGSTIDRAFARRSAIANRARRRAREEAALRQAAEAVTATFTVEEVIQDIARHALTATDADGALVERVDIETNEAVVVAVAGERILPLGSRVAFRGSLAEFVLELSRPEVIRVLSEERQRISTDLLNACPACSAVAVPLIDAGEAIGSLILLREPEREVFRHSEVERAKTFANLAALAFRKVHLLEETEYRREQLESVLESRARLVRGFSHDLKNPLGAADGYAQLLEDGVYGELSPKQVESVGRIRQSIRSALELINALVELARAEAGQIETEREAVDVREVAREMAEEYRAQAEAAGLRIHTAMPEHLPVISSDSSRIRQILGNLVSNAVKYTKQGEVTVRVEVRQNGRAPRPRAWVAVDVTDTGIGIPEEKQHLLFQEFSRLGQDSRPGVGLGLAISDRIAHALDGEITVASRPGQGSTFTLWLPAGEVDLNRPR